MAEPSNQAIFNELKAIVKDHEGRIRIVEQRQIAVDAADAAIAKYKQETAAANQPARSFSEVISKDFLAVIGKFITVFGALIAIIAYVIQYYLK